MTSSYNNTDFRVPIALAFWAMMSLNSIGCSASRPHDLETRSWGAIPEEIKSAFASTPADMATPDVEQPKSDQIYAWPAYVVANDNHQVLLYIIVSSPSNSLGTSSANAEVQSISKIILDADVPREPDGSYPPPLTSDFVNPYEMNIWLDFEKDAIWLSLGDSDSDHQSKSQYISPKRHIHTALGSQIPLFPQDEGRSTYIIAFECTTHSTHYDNTRIDAAMRTIREEHPFTMHASEQFRKLLQDKGINYPERPIQFRESWVPGTE